MAFPWYLIIPLAAAGLYAAASLFFKRAYAQGLGMMEAFYWLNFAGLAFFAPLFFWVGDWPAWREIWKPAVTAGLIYCGTRATFSAIRAGDVSLVTPLMGTKVVLTALVAVLLAGAALPAGLWVAAGLTTAGILVLGWRDLQRGQGKAAAVGWCLLSSLIFAAVDVSIGHWAAGYGRAAFLGTAFSGIGLVSLATVRWQAPASFRIPREARRFLLLGVVLMTVNTLAMGLCIAGFNDPTGVNIVYGTRGLWSIALVWFVGRRWFGNEERVTAGNVMRLRLTGSLLILCAVVVAVLARR
jgi:uncharacterized membrane protein